jgi:hypothetical protein
MSESKPETKEVLLELNANRIIVLTDRDKLYTLECRRITASDWEKYFASIIVTSEQRGKERINVIDVTSPRVALAEAVLISADGYKMAKDLELMNLPNWQTRIPLSHRQQLGETLAGVRASEAELSIHAEAEEVLLDATWGFNAELGGGRMQRFLGLKHILKTPTEAQHKRYSAEASRSRVIGGSRSGKTIYSNASLLLAKLYDELIVGAEGYSFNGAPLTTPDEIRREMDMSHKVMAAQEIFQPQNTASVAESEEE